MADKVFRRSRDSKVAGVCGGIAEYLGVEASLVRVAAVFMAFFIGFPVVLAYGVAAVAVPQRALGESDPPTAAVDWEADGVTITYSKSIAPHAMPWVQWIGWVVGGVLGLSLLSGLVFAVAAVLSELSGTDLTSLAALPLQLTAMLWPMLPVAVLGGMLPRPWTLTLTHDHLRIRRPLRAPLHIDLADVIDVRGSGDTLTLHLRSGELVSLPAPPDPEALAAFADQLDAGRQRALEYREDLEEATDERRELERVLAREREHEP